MYKIGVYEREITPMFGNSLEGYFNVRLVDGVIDKTYAKAVVIEKEGVLIAMLAIDSCMIYDQLIDTIYNRINKYVKIDRANVIISATHSHTAAPGGKNVEGADNALDALYLDWLANVCADTVVLAYQKRVDAILKYGETQIEGVAFCRNFLLKNGVVRTNPGVKNPDIVKAYGQTYDHLPVLFFEGVDGKKIGMMYSYALHQDSVDGTKVSGDWSSIVSYRMKEKFGQDFISIYFYGTAGNINQVDVTNDKINFFSCHEYLGNSIAKQMQPALESTVEIDDKINTFFTTKVYQSRVPTIEEVEENERIYHSVDLPEGAKLDASSPKELFDACMAKRCLNFTYSTPKYYSVKFGIITIGDVMIFALPGEVFTQFAHKIKNAFPDKKVFFIGLANNKWSYMPADNCYLPQLYESLYGSAVFYPEDVNDIFDSFIEFGKKM